MATTIKELENRILAIEKRNKSVEEDKAWETSFQRKLFVAFLTYCVVFIFLAVIKVANPFLSAIIPTMGYLLSTVSLSFLKKIWTVGDDSE